MLTAMQCLRYGTESHYTTKSGYEPHRRSLYVIHGSSSANAYLLATQLATVCDDSHHTPM